MSEPRKQSAADIAELKRRYVEYYRTVPIQKYAAMYVGRTEQRIIEWRKDDEQFSNDVEAARADFVKGRMLSVKAEFALERVERELFRDTKGIDVTSGGDKITFVNHVPLPSSEGTGIPTESE
jgi:hypothetical protein